MSDFPFGTYLGYKFNGANSYAQVPDNVAIDPTTFITIECRFALTVPLPSQSFNAVELVQKMDVTVTTKTGYAVYLTKGGSLVFLLKESNDSTYRQLVFSVGTTFDDLRLHVVTCVYDGSHIIAYTDGVFGSQVVATGSIQQDTGQSLNIGGFRIGTSPPNTNFFNGFIDEVRIWDTARTPTEISDNAWNQLTGAESGLVGYWKFNENSGTVATDSSPSGNDGTLSNTTRLALNYTPAVDANFSAQNPTLIFNQTVSPTASVSTFTASNPTLIFNQTVSPTASVATFSAQDPIIKETIQASPASATFSIPNATIIAGAVTIQANPAFAAFTANSIKNTLVINTSPGIINIVVGTPTIRLIQYATPSVITLAIPPPTIVLGSITVQASPAVANFSTNTITSSFIIYPSPVIATFAAQSPTIVLGALTVLPSPALVAFSANGITAGFVIYPTPVVATFALPDPTITNVFQISADPSVANFSANSVTTSFIIYPTPAIATFNANGITVDYVIYPNPAVAIFTLPTPTILMDQIVFPDPAIATFSIPTPTVFVVRITISFGVKIFNEINYHVIIENS